ncbi:type 4a pilus biogenesis protein PilO [Candidatus Berkelbacteria bacterium]|nr:type 4a pilus biogenesis protein PilO [Candidatus Berkelbacteria bacterium]
MTTERALGQRTNSLLYALLGVLVAALVGYFYVAPTVTKLHETRLATAALAADKIGYETRISEISALEIRLKQQQETLDRLALAVPPDAAIDELIVSLGALAESSGIVLLTVQPASIGDEAGTPVSVTARGSYRGIRLFLEKLEGNLRPVKITELSLASASDVTGASLVNASFKVIAAQATSVAENDPSSTNGAATKKGETQ